MPKVHLSCSEVMQYGRTFDMSDEDFAEYEDAVEREEGEAWFTLFAGRFIDPLNHAIDGEDFKDVEVTVLKTGSAVS